VGNKLPLFDLRHERYKSFWYSNKFDYKKSLLTNHEIRSYIMEISKKSRFDVADIVIHGNKSIKIDLHTSKPGLVLGKGGSNINLMKLKVASIANLEPNEVEINLVSINKPELDVQIVATKVAQDLERRRSPNSSMRTHIQDAIRFGALGARIECAGRLNGVEIARSVVHSQGKVPKQSIRANVHYSAKTAFTNSGTCGVKVWLNLPVNHGKRKAKGSFKFTDEVKSQRGDKE
jgi:small subunit ribosomal protein S3